MGKQMRLALAAILTLTGCMKQMESTYREDSHSFARPEQAVVRHVDLDLTVMFGMKRLQGTATLDVEGPGELTLDTRDLLIDRVEAWSQKSAWEEVQFVLGPTDLILGTPLRVMRAPSQTKVRVTYRTSESAKALQWLEPEQTAGKKHPFLFTQSQSIHARSWVPLQDSPGIRITYRARIRTPKELFAVMSADNTANTKGRTGDYTFEMKQPIPAYLLALAVGDLEFRAISERTGVYAEPAVVDGARKEFEDTEKMVQAVEKLYGPYRWGRYDILVCPPSFPFGGMENPRLTFVTPTVIAGDKSLVSLISHELAHSWSGNLVTNKTWRDFWLNEGVTTYVENRVQEELFGKDRAAKEYLIELGELREEMKRMLPADQHLFIDLKGRDPDDGATLVPYVKGASLLRLLEQKAGRAKFDAWIRSYFDQFAFQSITTEQFLQFLKLRLPESEGLDLQRWVYDAGMPEIETPSNVFAKVDGAIRDWAPGKPLDATGWVTQEYLRFLRGMPEKLGQEKMKALDEALKLTGTGNAEILTQWLKMSIANGYEPGLARLEPFLMSVGRQKMVRPLYMELAKTEAGKVRAREIFTKARAGYHPLTAETVAGILK